MSESIINIVLYTCSKSNRIIPKDWHKFTILLEELAQAKPPVPLILAAWHYTSISEKQQRFKQQLEWADSHLILEQAHEYLRSLQEEEWYHKGEL